MDEVIEHERAIRAMAENRQQVSMLKRFLRSSLLYTSLAGMIGAFIGWIVMEPFFEDVTTVSGIIREVLSNHTIAVCPACVKIVPVPADTEPGKCPECTGNLESDSSMAVRGLLKLDKTNIFMIPETTKLALDGDVEAFGAADGFSVSTPIKAKGMIFGRRSMVALEVEILPSLTQADEPDLGIIEKRTTIIALVWFGIIGGLIGLMIGCIEGIVCYNLRQSLVCGGIGLAIGFVGGLVGIYPAGLLYTAISSLSVALAGEASSFTVYDMHGWPLFTHIVGRSLAWGAVGMTLALGQGVARRSKKMIINGLIGGCMGGLFGGLLFDPIARFCGTDGTELSRGVGFVMIGLLVGLLIGLVEQLLKQVWLLVRTGPLSGKQFIAYKDEMIIGSLPKCDIYLFRDSLVRDEHARLVRLGRTYQLENLEETDDVFVNGTPVQKRILRSGDVITIGTTEFEYRDRGS